MMDLDSLKKINDTYGHRGGDAVLMHVAQKIQACIREIDVAARYGGDEFAIILPNTSLSDAMHVAERIAELIAENPVQIDGHELKVSVSIGLGQFRPDQTIENFMNETDGAMFEAKAAGKNRVHVCEI
jgi:diguanylate cyclase (GGDEF)-like protein